MAPLTWRNVDAPDLGRAVDILNSVSQNWGQGFDALSGALDKARKNQINRRSAPAFDILARVANEGDVAGALNQVQGMVRPEDRSPELMQALAALRDDALGYEGKRASTTSVLGSHNRAQQLHDRQFAISNQLAGMAKDIVAAQEDAMYGSGSGVLTSPAENNFTAHRIKAGLMQRGLPEHVADGFLLNFQDESAFDPTAVGDNGNALGLAQWNGPRKQALETFAAKRGKPATDLDTQLDFLMAELNGPEQGTLRELQNVRNMNEAAITILNRYERPAEVHRRYREAVYSGSGGQAPRISALIGKDNLVDPVTWMNIVTDIQTSGDKASRDRDDNRDRDYEFGRTVLGNERSDLAYNENRAATELALTATRNAESPAEIARNIADSDASAQVKTLALAMAQGLPVDQIQTLPFDPARTTPEGLDDAETAIQQYVTEQQSAIANNAGVRIMQNAENVYADGNAAVKLVERLKLPEDSAGETLAAVNRVAQALKVSPAVAASILEESAERGSWYNPFEGSITWNTNEAIALGKDILSPESMRASSEIRTQAAQNIVAAGNVQAQLAELARRIQVREANGQDTTEYRRAYDSLLSQARDIYQNRPIIGRAPSQEPVSNPEKAAAELLTKTPTSSNTSVDDIRARAESIAKEIIVELTGFAPENISRMDRRDLEEMIDILELQIIGQGGRNTDEMLAKLQTAREVLVKTGSR